MTHESIIDRWRTVADFARDIGVSYAAARFMRIRNSIHPKYWGVVISAANARGFSDITREALELGYPHRFECAVGQESAA